ncbi:MAG: cytochrome c [Acidimicrobiia bacterium]|nr:cytochrome c [Acidimicrobiia bacterium]
MKRPLLAALLILSACGPAVTDPQIEPQDPALVAVGAALYETNCAQCHGSDLRGTDQGPSQLSSVYAPSHHGDGAFLLAVMNGSAQHHWDFGPMPPIEGLSPSQVDEIIAFVREQQRLNGFESYPP